MYIIQRNYLYLYTCINFDYSVKSLEIKIKKIDDCIVEGNTSHNKKKKNEAFH